MPPQGTKDNLSPEKASMLKSKNFDDSYTPSDQLDQCIQRQAKTTKIFSALHVVNLALTLALLGSTVYLFKDVNQQLNPTELVAQHQIDSNDGEDSKSCCDDVSRLMDAREKLEQKVAAVESHLYDVKRMVEANLRADDRVAEAAPEPVDVAPVLHRAAQPGVVVFEKPQTDIEYPVKVEGSGSGVDLPMDYDYIFVDDYDDDPDYGPVEVLNPGDEEEASSGHGHPHHHHHNHHNQPKNTKCIEGFKPMCPNDCYDEVENEAGCMIPVCCRHKK